MASEKALSLDEQVKALGHLLSYGGNARDAKFVTDPHLAQVVHYLDLLQAYKTGKPSADAAQMREAAAEVADKKAADAEIDADIAHSEANLAVAARRLSDQETAQDIAAAIRALPLPVAAPSAVEMAVARDILQCCGSCLEGRHLPSCQQHLAPRIAAALAQAKAAARRKCVEIARSHEHRIVSGIHHAAVQGHRSACWAIAAAIEAAHD